MRVATLINNTSVAKTSMKKQRNATNNAHKNEKRSSTFKVKSVWPNILSDQFSVVVVVVVVVVVDQPLRN